MKHLKFVLGLVSMASLVFFSSCDTDEEEDALGPVFISLEADATTIAPEDSVTFSWEVRAGDAKLESFSIQRNNEFSPDAGGNSWNAVKISSSPYVGSATFQIDNAESSYTFRFTVKDKDGLEDSETIPITVEGEASKTLYTYTSKNVYAPLGDGSSNTFVDLENGTVFSNNTITSDGNSADIDLGFYLLTSDQILVSPSAIPTNVYDIGWETINTTNLKTSSVSNFSLLTDELSIESAWTSSGTEETSINSIAQGDVILFSTALGNKGAIKINSVNRTGDYTGNINIDIKVIK